MSPELFENVLGVIADRCRADAEPIRDLLGVLTLRKQSQDFTFPIGEWKLALDRWGRFSSWFHILQRHLARERGVELLHELLHFGLLRDVSKQMRGHPWPVFS